MRRVGELKSAFNFGFNDRLVKNGGAAGIFDETNRQQLVVATESNKILLQSAESVLHVDEPVTCLLTCSLAESGYFDPDSLPQHMDGILVGTKTTLMLFDVYNNRTVFRREMPDGVNCLRVGRLDEYTSELIVAGCGTTIWGLGLDGRDMFWTALGDVINAIETCDIDGDGKNELIVGSDGAEIKVFKNAAFWTEYDEGDPCIALCSLGTGSFAFGLNSGVVGVYTNGERCWRVKTKSQVVGLHAFPDPSFTLCVWKNCKIDVRGTESGEIFLKEQVGEGEVVGSFLCDVNGSGSLSQLAVTYRNGQVRGLEFTQESDPSTILKQTEKLMQDYGQRKHHLLEELKNYERSADVGGIDEGAGERQPAVAALPPDTTLSSFLDISPEKGLCLRLALSNSVPIRAVLLFGEGIFDSECYAIHPNMLESSELSAYFCPTKDSATELFVKAIVGASAEQTHVFEVNQVLPKFATFLPITSSLLESSVAARRLLEDSNQAPKSFVEFNMGHMLKIDSLTTWLTENFLFTDTEWLKAGNQWTERGAFSIKFIATRAPAASSLNKKLSRLVSIEIQPSGEAVIRMDDIESCGNLLQSLCAHLATGAHVKSRAFFPCELEAVEAATNTLDEKYELSDKLSSDWAGRLNAVRECVVRAEDSLTIGELSDAKKLYVRVAMLNRELVGQQAIRIGSRDAILSSLKAINLAIEQFSRLRVGVPASKMIQECRKAIASEDLNSLPKLLQFGAL